MIVRQQLLHRVMWCVTSVSHDQVDMSYHVTLVNIMWLLLNGIESPIIDSQILCRPLLLNRVHYWNYCLPPERYLRLGVGVIASDIMMCMKGWNVTNDKRDFNVMGASPWPANMHNPGEELKILYMVQVQWSSTVAEKHLCISGVGLSTSPFSLSV